MTKNLGVLRTAVAAGALLDCIAMMLTPLRRLTDGVDRPTFALGVRWPSSPAFPLCNS